MSDLAASGAIDILIVEDDKIDVEVIRRAFKKRNITNPVHHASCGVEALEMLRSGKDISLPCILLVDINMPRMNGTEFLEEVRKDESLKDSVAFVLTTSARATDIKAAYALNTAGYFLKGDIDRLAELLDLYREINTFPPP